jgi:Large ribosomal RNA subunit accumulation protein YceD
VNTWPAPLRLHALGSGAVDLTLVPDADQRAEAAEQLGLEALPALTAQVTVQPWLDGAEITGAFQALVTQICGVTLDPFEAEVAGEFRVRVVPAGSPHAIAPEDGAIDIDPEAPDPPDELASDEIDVTGYVLEHLALELDPFPRKPGASFEYQPATAETSPFAALAALKGPKA